MEFTEICRHCGGVIRAVPARNVYGPAVNRLGLQKEYIYQCQNCNARVGCHKGTLRPLGNVANETLRLKRKVNDIRAMALEAQEEYETARGNQSKANAVNKALIKLRGELLRLYAMQQKLAAAVQSDGEKDLVDALLADMELISRRAHEAANFTYAPLEQLAALQ